QVVSSNILLSFSTSHTQPLTIRKFSTAFFHSSGPINFTLQVDNASDKLESASGSVIFTNWFGRQVGVIPLKKVYFLGPGKRFLTNSANASSSLAWNEKFILGPYTATASIKNSAG